MLTEAQQGVPWCFGWIRYWSLQPEPQNVSGWNLNGGFLIGRLHRLNNFCSNDTCKVVERKWCTKAVLLTVIQPRHGGLSVRRISFSCRSTMTWTTAYTTCRVKLFTMALRTAAMALLTKEKNVIVATHLIRSDYFHHHLHHYYHLCDCGYWSSAHGAVKSKMAKAAILKIFGHFLRQASVPAKFGVADGCHFKTVLCSIRLSDWGI